jgi:predicted Zn-dependent protease
MGNSFIKDVAYIVLIAIGVGVIDKHLEKYDYDVKAAMYDVASDYDKNHPISNTKPSDGVSTTDKVVRETPSVEEYESSKVIYIHGLGSYNAEDLKTVKQGIEDFYGIKCVISTSKSTNSELYDNGNRLMAYRVLNMGNGGGNVYDMYVTDESLCVSDEKPSLISGHARLNAHCSVVSTREMKNNGHYSSTSLIHTATHELGHNFGLGHCDNQSCLMKSHGLDTKHFCDDCRRKINN